MALNRICFVCNGNNSRSVMAEFIAKKEWQDKISVMSCGINASEGSDIASHTRQALAEIGIDIGNKHRNKISAYHLRKNVYYFAMDEKVRIALINDYKVMPDRISILNPQIMDPKDCEMDVYRECRDLIQESIKRVDLNEIF